MVVTKFVCTRSDAGRVDSDKVKYDRTSYIDPARIIVCEVEQYYNEEGTERVDRWRIFLKLEGNEKHFIDNITGKDCQMMLMKLRIVEVVN